jgi:hypothetical protein
MAKARDTGRSRLVQGCRRLGAVPLGAGLRIALDSIPNRIGETGPVVVNGAYVAKTIQELTKSRSDLLAKVTIADFKGRVKSFV